MPPFLHRLAQLIRLHATSYKGLRPWQRHGQVLTVAGTVYIYTGLVYALTPTTASRESALRVALEWAPLSFYGIVFIVVGSLAIVSSRWPPASETWGYTAMTGLAVAWAGVYLFGIVFGAPLGGLSAVSLWGMIGYLWYAISGLVNPADLQRMRPPGGEAR